MKDKIQNKENLKIFKVKDIKVYYYPKLDGGGTSFGQLYIPVLKRFIGNPKGV